MAPSVRLNGINNEPLGIVTIQEALRLSGEADVDLVEMAREVAEEPIEARPLDLLEHEHESPIVLEEVEHANDRGVVQARARPPPRPAPERQTGAAASLKNRWFHLAPAATHHAHE